MMKELELLAIIGGCIFLNVLAVVMTVEVIIALLEDKPSESPSHISVPAETKSLEQHDALTPEIKSAAPTQTRLVLKNH